MIKDPQRTNIVIAAIGLPLCITAVLVAFKRKKYLTFRILAGVPEVAGENSSLLTEGIYRTIRHPRHVEFILGGTGWALIINYTGVYIITAIAIAVIYVIVPLEERELRDRFGQEYIDYCARVPRLRR